MTARSPRWPAMWQLHIATVSAAATALFVLLKSDSIQTHFRGVQGVWKPQIDDVMPILKRFAVAVKVTPARTQGSCKLQSFGKGWGNHSLCDRPPTHRLCNFYSFGISTDYSFDLDIAKRWRCQGFAADPTIVHDSLLHKRITFHNVGAKMLNAAGAKPMFPIVTSVPALRKWLQHDYVEVLKMDCEGCEYSIARDIILEDPSFFSRVGQFAVEVHTSKHWVGTDEAVYSLGKLIQLLEEAGLVLQDWEIGKCGRELEATGCIDALVEAGIPCGIGKSCHNYLFARV